MKEAGIACLPSGAETVLKAEEAGEEQITVVSSAAYRAPSGTLSAMFQAGALIELPALNP